MKKANPKIKSPVRSRFERRSTGIDISKSGLVSLERAGSCPPIVVLQVRSCCRHREDTVPPRQNPVRLVDRADNNVTLRVSLNGQRR